MPRLASGWVLAPWAPLEARGDLVRGRVGERCLAPGWLLPPLGGPVPAPPEAAIALGVPAQALSIATNAITHARSQRAPRAAEPRLGQSSLIR